MRVVVQRVKRANVTVDSRVVGSIETGLCLLVGLHRTDTMEEVKSMCIAVLKTICVNLDRVGKISKLKLFGEEKGDWKQNVRNRPDLRILAVSQFTLYARTDKGAKPDFSHAMRSEQALEHFNAFVQLLQEDLGDPDRVQTGAFGRLMVVNIVNDGPVTIILECTAKSIATESTEQQQ